MNCPVCGNLLKPNVKECAVCGADVQAHEVKEQKVEKGLKLNLKLLIIGLIALVLLMLVAIFDLTAGAQVLGAWGSGNYPALLVAMNTILLLFWITFIVFQIILIVQVHQGHKSAFREKVPFIGFILMCIIALAVFLYSILGAAFTSGAGAFFQPLLLNGGLIAIYVWLYFIAEKPEHIFPKPNPTPNSEPKKVERPVEQPNADAEVKPVKAQSEVEPE